MSEPALTIEGIQEAQQANLRWIAAVQPQGGFGRAVKDGIIKAHRYAVSITHIDTGALRASHRMLIEGDRAEIYIDPSSVNPRGERPAVYGVEEHNRGSGHAFYARTMTEKGHQIAEGMAHTIIQSGEV